MIDLTQLNQEQLWGLQYAVLLANQGKPAEEHITTQQYADNRFREICNSWYGQIIAAKKVVFEQRYNAASDELKEQINQLLGVPDIL